MAAFVASSRLSAAWAIDPVPMPPVARVVPVTETLFGTTPTDNYCWTENDKDRDWLPYLKGQNAVARAALAAIPGRDALLKRGSALSGDAAAT
ncbi:MAG: S9 family peptidase, partial [Sphingomonadaceae bacterium]|nr:S9 family peptidase [Sphingomonadaceae bacterium]